MRTIARRIIFLPLFLIFSCAESTNEPQDQASTEELSETVFIGQTIIRHAPQDADTARELTPMVAEAIARVEGFFEQSFDKTFTIRLFPDRTALDAHWAESWGGEDFSSQCWMVASGVADELALLSPAVWMEQACEHDADTGHITRILAHELTHVYHGQQYVTPDFSGMDDLGWFAEGAAVLVSGQLDEERRRRAREAIENGAAPTALTEAWSGEYRYAVAGTLAELVHDRLGAAGFRQALGYASLSELLTALGMREAEVLELWRERIISAGQGEPED